MTRRLGLIVLGLALAVPPALLRADEEAGNVPHVFADRWNRCYARSVPVSSYGSEGTTQVFLVDAGGDRLVDTYRWYSSQLHLECFTPVPQGSAVAVVQLGPWARGSQASAGHLAIAFYAGGSLLRRYSTLDIAGTPNRVSRSVSHYGVFRTIDGFVTEGQTSVFRVVTVDGRQLTFEPGSGELVDSRPAASP